MEDDKVRPISEIAGYVRDRRTQLRLSQRRAASLADVSSTTWQGFEKHHHAVSELTLAGMADALRWPRDWFDRLRAGESPAALDEPTSIDDTDESWDDLKSSLSEEDRAIIRAMIERLQGR